MKVSLPRAWTLTLKISSNELRFWFSLFFVVELQSSSCFLKVSLPRAWNVSPRLGSNELKIWFSFFHSLWLNFKPQAVYQGLDAESLKSEPRAWLTWADILIIFSFFVIELQILSCFMKVSLPRAWNLTSKVGSNELRIWFFLFFVVELQTSSCFMKVLLPRAWNLTPTLGPNELKFKVLFSIMWLNFKPQAVLWRSVCRELEIYAQGLAHMSWNFEYFFVLCDWTSNLKLFYESLVAESLKSDPKGWLKWGKILIFLILCGWTSKLKLFYEGLVAESLKCLPKACLKW
jgi:hypothetical protein